MADRDDSAPGQGNQGHRTDYIAATAKQQAEPTVIVIDPSDIASLLELSGVRDLHLSLRHQAFREGWQAAERAHADDYSRGYVDGLLRRKHIEHDAVEAAQLEMRRWTVRGVPRTRETFSQPHPDDYPGRGGAAA